MGSELSCTQGKRGEGGWNGGGDENERTRSLPLSPSSRPSIFFFLREFFSRALLSERLEQASGKNMGGGGGYF